TDEDPIGCTGKRIVPSAVRLFTNPFNSRKCAAADVPRSPGPHRLPDGYSNRLTTESMRQFSRPGFERFRRVGEIAMLDTAMSGEFERPGMRLICPIDSHECSKLDFIFLLRVYHLECSC